MHHARSRRADHHITRSRARHLVGALLISLEASTARHAVEAADASSRVDVLVARLSGRSRSQVAGAIREGRVTVNGSVPKPSLPLSEGDIVEYDIALPAQLVVRPEPIPLDVVFEDDAILVVDKPAGMVTHPAHGTLDGTLVNALAAHVAALPGDPLRGGLVHRLDRDTSGLLVIAKTEAALGTLGRAMQKRYIRREYRGIVTGTPDDANGTITGAIGRDPRNRLRYAITSDGKPAVTHYAIREKLRGASELTFRLETGRTHQIRVHMHALGHPIVNDPLYGRRDGRVPLPGQALHAWRLAFKHPLTKEHLAFESEPPPAYRETLELFAR